MNKRSNSYHPDIQIFLVLIPFIAAFNYYLTYSNIKVGWFLVLTFSIDTTQGYIAWWAVRAFIIYLDKKWTYEKGGWKRIVFQMVATMVIGLFIISMTTELVSWMAKGEPAHPSFYLIDLFIIAIWFFVINGIYIGLYYYRLWKSSEEKREEAHRVKAGGLLLRQGKQDLLLPYEDLSGMFVEGEYVAVCHIKGQKYFINESMNIVEKKLPTDFFFRLNRKTIVHRQLVAGFKRIENGKLQVVLNANENMPYEISVSRLKAAAFKEWFRLD